MTTTSRTTFIREINDPTYSTLPSTNVLNGARNVWDMLRNMGDGKREELKIIWKEVKGKIEDAEKNKGDEGGK